MTIGRIYPDYGTPGNPNLDPYYLSPKEEKEAELASLETELEAVLEARFRREMCDTRRYAHEEPYALAIEERKLREKIEEMKKELRQ